MTDDLDDFGKYNFDNYEQYLTDNKITVTWDPGWLLDGATEEWRIDPRFACWSCDSPIGGEPLGGSQTPEGELYARRSAAILIFLVKKGIFWPVARELAIGYVQFTDQLKERRKQHEPPNPL